MKKQFHTLNTVRNFALASVLFLLTFGATSLTATSAQAQGTSCDVVPTFESPTSVNMLMRDVSTGLCALNQLQPQAFYSMDPSLFFGLFSGTDFRAVLPNATMGPLAITPAKFSFRQNATILTIDSVTCDGATIGGVDTTDATVALPDNASCELTIIAGGNLVSLSGGTLAQNGQSYTLSASELSGGTYGGNVASGSSGSPEIQVTGNGVDIETGDISPSETDDTDFGSIDPAAGTISRTFTINNSGDAELTLGQNAVKIINNPSGEFTITQQPSETVAASGGSTTFTIEFDPGSVGLWTAEVSIGNNDADESPFTFTIAGTGQQSTGDINIEVQIEGEDTSVAFTSATTELNDTITTTSGTGQSAFNDIAAGTHEVTAADLTEAGYALTAISCDHVDSSGNVSTRMVTIEMASGLTITCTFFYTESGGIAERAVSDFVIERTNAILANQATSQRRLNRIRGVRNADPNTSIVTPLGYTAIIPTPVEMDWNSNLLSYAASAQSAVDFLGRRTGDIPVPELGTWDVWSEGSISFIGDGANHRGQFGIVHLGVDSLITEQVLIGARVQVDWMDQDLEGTDGSVQGIGFMVGPYATISLSENLYLDMSGAIGLSDNAISPLGTYTDNFVTTRWMLDAALIGSIELDNWEVQPTLAITHFAETQHAYTDSLSVPVAEQTASQTEISFAPRLSHSFETESGLGVTPWGEVGGHYTAEDGLEDGEFSSSIASGLDLQFDGGVSSTIGVNLHGLGTDTQTYGGSISLRAPLN